MLVKNTNPPPGGVIKTKQNYEGAHEAAHAELPTRVRHYIYMLWLSLLLPRILQTTHTPTRQHVPGTPPHRQHTPTPHNHRCHLTRPKKASSTFKMSKGRTPFSSSSAIRKTTHTHTTAKTNPHHSQEHTHTKNIFSKSWLDAAVHAKMQDLVPRVQNPIMPPSCSLT